MKGRVSVTKILVYVVLIVGSIIFLMPLVWMVSTALKSGEAIFQYPPRFIPEELHWENFKLALTILPFGRFFLNTIVIVGLSLIGTVLSCAVVGFGFARLRFPGRDVLFFIVLATMMIPYPVTTIPVFIMFRKMGWIDTFLPLTVPAFFGNAFFIFLLRQFYLSIPMELDDAAKIDGCSSWQIFCNIHLPLIKPALITMAVLHFIGAWNDFFGPLIYLTSQRNYTLALGLATFRGMYSTDWELLMAASLVVVTPAIIVFFFAQRKIIEGITLTGMRG